MRDVILNVDGLDPGAFVDTALVTLLPGESHTFVVAGWSGLDSDAIVSVPALRCVNEALAISV